MTVFSVIVFVQAVAAIIGLFTIVVLCMKPASYYQKMATITAVCSFIGLLSYLLELLSTNLSEALLAARFGYIGKSYAMMLFLVFIAKYCDFKMPRWVVVLLIAFSTVVLFIVMTCPYHDLYYSYVDFTTEGAFPHLILGKGIIYYMFMAVTILVMLAFMAICVVNLSKRQGEDRKRLMLLCLSGLLPAIGLILNLTSFMQGFDPTPLGIMASCCLVAYNVIKYGLLDTIQLASENAMDAASAGLIVISKARYFLYANKTAYDIFPELGNKAEAGDMLATLFDGIDENNTETRIFNRDNVIYELNYSALNEGDEKKSLGNNGYMAWIFDKTREYNHKRELERLKLEAENANKSKSMFLAKMSHEIRTPMNGVMGFANLALENNPDEETAECLEYIKNSAESLLQIINDVLDISKIESGKMELVELEYNPARVFDEIVKLIKTQAESKNLTFNVDVSKDIPTVLVGDSIKLREILINILNNAVKYTNEGGITLEVKCKSEDEHAVMEITVTDTGIGIKADKLDSIFNSFEQVDNVSNYHVEGTGLGLSIAKQLTELMGGNINVNSKYGSGSEFIVTIPQKYVMTVKNVEKQDAIEVDIVAGNLKVLVVDDNMINLKVERGILQKYGMDVEICESGKECLALTSKNKYDIIFMDHMMPEMDGVETMQAIRKRDGEDNYTPIILVTANAIVGVKEEMLSLGFDGFVSKPIDRKELNRELAKVLPDDKIESITSSTNVASDNKSDKDFVSHLMTAGINVEEGIKYCGDMESYIDVLKIMVSGYGDKRLKIKTYLETEDIDNYRIIVHSLKSGAANVGAVELSALAKELEYAAKDKDKEFIVEYTDRLLEMYEKVVETIKSSLPQENVAKDGAKANLEPEHSLEEILQSIAYCLEELDSDGAIIHIDEALSMEISGEIVEKLNHMKEAVDVFDMEAAKNYLVEIKNK